MEAMVWILIPALFLLTWTPGCALADGERAAGAEAGGDRPGTVSLAVLRTRLDDPAAFQPLMADALRALSGRGGVQLAVQIQSLEDPHVYGDLVVWRSPEEALAAAEWAETSDVCRAYFEATAEDYTFGHVADGGGSGPLRFDAPREGEVIYVAHVVPLGDVQALGPVLDGLVRRWGETSGCVRACWGVLEGDRVGGLVVLAAWGDADRARSELDAIRTDAPWSGVGSTEHDGLFGVRGRFEVAARSRRGET